MKTVFGPGLIALILTSMSAHAIGPIRCYGRVQFSPCQVVATLPPVKRAVRTPAGTPALVTAQSFQQLSTLRGRWRGKIQGNGLVSVWLHILNGNKPIEQTYLGNIPISDQDGPVPFDYIGPLPKTRSWTWKVVAIAQPMRSS